MSTEVTYRSSSLLLEQARPPSTNLWTLSRDRLTIGRDPSSDVFVDDPGISRNHAELIRRGPDWSIVDAGSTNGTYVNGARVRETIVRPGDRIGLGNTELVMRSPEADRTHREEGSARYDVGSQLGNISNVAGNQSNYYRESNLRYIASRRGRSRRLIVGGLWLFFIGQGLGVYAVLSLQNTIFKTKLEPSSLPPQFILAALAAILSLLGIALFIFGLIARSGAKREAQRLGARWS